VNFESHDWSSIVSRLSLRLQSLIRFISSLFFFLKAEIMKHSKSILTKIPSTLVRIINRKMFLQKFIAEIFFLEIFFTTFKTGTS